MTPVSGSCANCADSLTGEFCPRCPHRTANRAWSPAPSSSALACSTSWRGPRHLRRHLQF